MTLIIASAQHDVQFIVADRRLSVSKVPCDDWAYKIVQYWNKEQGYAFLIAYTGLAEWKWTKWKTLDWLMGALPKVFDARTDIGQAISAFSNKCEQDIKKVPLNHRALTILLCGRYNRSGPDLRNPEYIPFIAVISNHINRHGSQTDNVSHEFQAYSAKLLKPKAHITLCRGDLQAASVYSRDFIQARRLIRRPISYKAKVRIAVDYVRKVAEKSKTVGKNILGAALLQPGYSEGFDFPENADVMVRTMPHVISADGSRVTDFKIVPVTIEEAGDARATLPKHLILTRWTGSGESADDARRPEIADRYKLQRCVDVTAAFAWERGEECPYYGLVVACDADHNTFKQLLQDERYFVLAASGADLVKPISEDWLKDLIAWLLKNGMPSEMAERIERNWMFKSASEVVSKVIELLRQPKPGFESTERHPPSSGTKHGIGME